MGFLKDISTVFTGGNHKKRDPPQSPTLIQVVEAPPPTRDEEVRSWLNEGTIPRKLQRMDDQIYKMFGIGGEPKTPRNENHFVNKAKKRGGCDCHDCNEPFKDAWMHKNHTHDNYKTQNFDNSFDGWDLFAPNKKRRK